MSVASVRKLVLIALAIGSGWFRLVMWPGAQRAKALPDVLDFPSAGRIRRLTVGSVIRLATDASGTEREFAIGGIYEPTAGSVAAGAGSAIGSPAPARSARHDAPGGMPAGAEYIASVNVALVDPGDAQQFAKDVNARMPGWWRWPSSEAPDRPARFACSSVFHLAIAVVTIVAATVFLLALTIMLVDERRETVGVLRLIGCRCAASSSRSCSRACSSPGPVPRSASCWPSVRTADQPVLPVAIRHRARLRPHHPGRRAHLRSDRRSAGASATVVASWALLRRGAAAARRR